MELFDQKQPRKHLTRNIASLLREELGRQPTQREYNSRYYKERYHTDAMFREKVLTSTKAYAKTHAEQWKEYGRRWRQSSSGKTHLRQKALKRLYGLTGEEFDSILTSQGGTCAICGSTDWGSRQPHVDHSHETQAIRGILCAHCNRGLGGFKDNPLFLTKAIEYLSRSANEHYCQGAD